MHFKTVLLSKIKKSLYNNFGKENFDHYRFDSDKYINYTPILSLKTAVKKIIGYNSEAESNRVISKIDDKLNQLNDVYNILQPESRILFTNIVAYRLLGSKKIKINGQAKNYLNRVQNAPIIKVSNKTIQNSFMNTTLEHLKFNFNNQPIELYFSKGGIVVDFLIEQYALKLNNGSKIEAEKNDIVLDIGGCWGDTAVYFASKVGNEGKVYSFEFIPGNISNHKINSDLNLNLTNIIKLIPNPVSDKSNVPIFFQDNGPASKIEFKPFKEQTGETTTLSIDDFFEAHKLETVDFIKMDIEGAELSALKGGCNTIKKYKPKLAIAVYHNNWDDLINIPIYLNELGLNYEFYLGHFTIHTEETILFAKPIK